MDWTSYRNLAEMHQDTILNVERHLWKHPETGFREWNTSEYLAEIFQEAGYELHFAGNVPGFYTDIDTGRPGPKILIMGEMDCLIQPNHPAAVEGRAHSCGHHVQCASLVGVALALKEPGVLDGLCGSIRLMAVPAEEMIEVEFRNSLRQQGIIRYLGGKTEFIYRGYMDGCDMAFLFHAAGSIGWYDFIGCMSKEITFSGKAAHAGSSPHLGVNSLYAATLGLQAINSLRETFQDDDHIRVHPIITQGGNVVNTIPDQVKISTYVRGKTLEAIAFNNRKISRALAGTALALGANVTVSDRPGYAPLTNSRGLVRAAVEVASELVGADSVDGHIYQAYGSTDMGDLCCLMPVFQANFGGCAGSGHSDEFRVVDPHMACVNSAAMYLMLTAYLLENDAVRAREILDAEKPAYESKEQYLQMIDQFLMDQELITYTENGASVLF